MCSNNLHPLLHRRLLLLLLPWMGMRYHHRPQNRGGTVQLLIVPFHLPRHHQCTTVLHLEKIRRCLLRLLVITLNVFLRHCTVLLMTAQSVKPANVRAAILYQKNANYMSINTATRMHKTIVDVCCLIVGLKQRADLLNQRMHHHQFRCRLMFRLHPYFSTTQR